MVLYCKMETFHPERGCLNTLVRNDPSLNVFHRFSFWGYLGERLTLEKKTI